MSHCYLIAGGGTGGHIFPAVAIGQALLAKKPDAQVLFVGTRYGMECSLIPKLGYRLLKLPIRGLLGKGLGQKLALLWRLPASLILSAYFLFRYRPRVVIGVGGYASGPMLWTAALFRRPTFIQEQNAFPGLTNRLCAKIARMACLGFAEAEAYLNCPSLVTGNPVRPAFIGRQVWQSQRDTVLVLGGSQGARALNREMPQLLAPLFKGDTPLQLVHQAGRGHMDGVRQSYGEISRVQVVDFIEDVASLMDRVRLVICRAGASTISELKHLAIPAVLVPFPGATGDHQTHNAKTLSQTGSAWLIPEPALSQAGAGLIELIGDNKKLQTMADAYSKTLPNSADMCARVALALEDGRAVDRIIEELQVHVP